MTYCREGLRQLSILAGAVALAVFAGSAPSAQALDWKSGSRSANNVPASAFATWRGAPLGVVSDWIEWKKGWTGMYDYASGGNPRSLRAMSSNVTFAHGLFPADGNLTDCAAGSYDDEQRNVASRLAANGVGDAEIRLGWEASGDWFPWSAAGRPPQEWKNCFRRVANAMKSVAPNLRIGWFMAKKGRVDVRTIYPYNAPITNIGVSHYDDEQARFGYETYLGGPWGLRAWVEFARSKGKKFAIGEWGVGRIGDNPAYVQNMHEFFVWAGDSLAHEAYFNNSEYQLYPVGGLPESSERYQLLF